MSVMYIRNEQTGEFEPVPSLVGPQGPPGTNGDGAGTVTAVNNVAPDTTGNVTLTAAKVGARPDTWTPTASDVGALPSDGTAVNAAQLNGKSADQYALKKDIPNASNPLDAYPVGSIYMSVNNTSPAGLFGGTWEQLKDRLLLGAGDSYAAGSTGGEAAVTLSYGQSPERGSLYYDYDGNGSTIPADRCYLKKDTWSYSNGNVKGYTNYFGSTINAQPHNNMPPYLAVNMWKRVS